jgi:tRNA U38,U39,U40 pseudouridine synthase TruA
MMCCRTHKIAMTLALPLVASRFLRQMVRVLVSTAVREAIPDAGWAEKDGDEALLSLVRSLKRQNTCPPAPADGLCLIGVEYEEAC